MMPRLCNAEPPGRANRSGIKLCPKAILESNRELEVEVQQRRHHIAKWIVTAATAFDAAQGMLQLPAQAAQVDADESSSLVGDLEQFLQAAKLPVAAAAALAEDVIATGARDVQELCRDDWEQLPSWVSLRPLERRRLLQFVRPTRG